jgi:hypothetical protein
VLCGKLISGTEHHDGPSNTAVAAIAAATAAPVHVERLSHRLVRVWDAAPVGNKPVVKGELEKAGEQAQR